jgi:hypothetical protein
LKRIVASLVLIVCLAVPAVSAATTFAVNTTADGVVAGTCAAGEECTLRDALAAASAGTEPENVVTLPAGTYGLTEGELSLPSNSVGTIRIVGAGARHTVIDAGGMSRVLRMNNDSTVIENLTITGGAATGTTEELAGDGGGVVFGLTSETGTFRGDTISGNQATLNGGGIAAPPESLGGEGKTVTIEDSTISGNKIGGGAVEALGGGLYVLGELTMSNSSVTGNVAESTAGAQEGGGVLAGPSMTEVTTTSTAIVNSTIAGNSVGLGGTGGGLSIYNPGGLIEPTSKLTNTIIAGNKVGEMASNCGPLTITSKSDLSSDGSCMFTDSASKKETDPKLAGLANNGGETDTLALVAGSPAIDAGTSEGCPATDQRGVARPVGSACDIGAYEYQPPAPTTAATATTPVAPGPVQTADLKLTLKPQPKKPRRGKKFSFAATITNAGPAAATGAVFKATVPPTTGKVKIKGLGKNACKLGKAKKKKRMLTCALGTLAVGKTLKLKIPVKTKKAPKKLVVNGSVTSTLPDPSPNDAKAKAVAKLKG